MDKIQEILSRAKPTDWEEKTASSANPNNNTNIIINKTDNHSLAVLITVIVLICTVFNLPGHMKVSSPFSDAVHDKIVPADKITSAQSDFIKNKIRNMARCMKIHPNKLHAELRKKFNFHSIPSLDSDTYEKLIIYLNSSNPCK